MFSESSFGIYLKDFVERNLNPTTREPWEQHLGEVWQGMLKFTFNIAISQNAAIVMT